jgi:hypothetical protein
VDASRRNRTRGQWSLSWALAIGLHQLFIPIVTGNQIRQDTFLIYIIYFGVIAFLFTWTFLFLPPWLVVVIIFMFGGFVETTLFGAVPNFFLAGLLYVVMFGLPRWIARRIWKPETETP